MNLNGFVAAMMLALRGGAKQNKFEVNLPAKHPKPHREQPKLSKHERKHRERIRHLSRRKR
jgi:hypothetical protein